MIQPGPTFAIFRTRHHMPPICGLYNTSKQYRFRTKIKQTSKKTKKQNKTKKLPRKIKFKN